MAVTKTILLGLCCIFIAMAAAFAQSRITYLPRDEDIITVPDVPRTFSPPKILGEVDCADLNQLYSNASVCNFCIQNLVPQCPDCCLSLTSPRAVKCSAAYNATLYDCKPQPFDSQTCSNVLCDPALFDGKMGDCANPDNIPGCQNKGCPRTTRPNDSSCVQYDDIWSCDANNLGPRLRCLASSPLAKTPECNITQSEYYNITANATAGWWDYEPTQKFEDCIDFCQEYADDYEKCSKRVFCCYRQPCCPGATTPCGADETFLNMCNDQACNARLSQTNCDTKTAEICLDLNNRVAECIAGKCGDCFSPVDGSLDYTFVAKSKQSMTILWQLSTRPPTFEASDYFSNVPFYFYTMVKVFRLGGAVPVLVHKSMVHQKALEAATSIFCATHIPKTMLEQGRSYQVKLYYYLPSTPDYDLSVELNSAQLIILKIRE